LCTKFDFLRIIRGKSELSVDYTSERHAFPGLNSGKVKTFRGLYRIIIRGKACDCKLFCVKEGFLSHGKIRGKSKLSAYHTPERHAFLQGNPRKVKTFRELPYGKFQYTTESQNNTFKGRYLLPQIILDKNSTMGDQYNARFQRKNLKKHGATENNNLTFRR
jgi:hypothetical protein